MFGFRRLNRRYRRFRYNNQARFPRLFVIFDMLKLPFQLLLVAVPLWIAVGAYNENFSFDAQRYPGDLVSATASSSHDTTAALVTIDRSVPGPGTDNQPDVGDEALATKTLKEEQALPVASVSATSESVAAATQPDLASDGSAPEVLNNGDNVFVSTVPFTPIEELPDDGSAVVPDLPPASRKLSEVTALVEQLSGPSHIHEEPAAVPQVRDAGWLVAQNDSSYVIQLESSANRAVMQKQALKLSSSGDLAIYPFVVSSGGEVIYGMSYGLYDTLEQARLASTALPGDLVRFGTWIRQVGTLKRQMQAIGTERREP